jgi:crotonobetainyl-CoA:carnitine CoA-transferase CaiB-like acyl-CoA transferase
MNKALQGLRVLEIAEGVSGPYCGKLMAGLGADVTKIEPPDGDASRRAGPFPGDVADIEQSGLFLYLNTGKKSVALDLDDAESRRLAFEMACASDIVIENHAPGHLADIGLGYDALSAANPRLIMVSITPFGQYGPYRDFASSDMVVHALSGELYLAGRPEREALKKGGNLAEYHGGLNGYLGALAALHACESTGRGQHVDVSLLEGATSVIGMAVMRWEFAQTVDKRRGGDGQPWPNGIWPVNDGYILAYSRPSIDWWSLFVKMMDENGMPEFADPRYASATGRSEHVEELDGLFQAWLVNRTKEEVYHLTQSFGLPFGYVATAPDMLASPQLRAREFYKEIEHPVAGKLPYPGAPFGMSKTPFGFTHAPLLGEHTEEVRAALGRT